VSASACVQLMHSSRPSSGPQWIIDAITASIRAIVDLGEKQTCDYQRRWRATSVLSESNRALPCKKRFMPIANVQLIARTRILDSNRDQLPTTIKIWHENMTCLKTAR
jgi:hypothetical protein